MRRYLPHLTASAPLAILAVVVFGRVLTADFVQWDDDINIYRNPKLGPISFERIAWMFGDLKYQWRYQPLTWLSWCLVHQFFQLDPFGYHLANLLLHACN